MTTIYILKLESDKYYIGKTNNLRRRMKSHFKNNGSQWTRKHKPIKIIETITENIDEFSEDRYTLIYMKRYGIINVRGGSFVKNILRDEEIYVIKRMLISSNNLCFKCGESGHFARECANINIIDTYITKEEDNMLIRYNNTQSENKELRKQINYMYNNTIIDCFGFFKLIF